MEDMLILGGSLVAVLLFVLVARMFYFSKPRKFPGQDGRKWTWNPDGSFTDPDGRPVTDAETIARCQEDWEELERRTARQTTAIHQMGFLGRFLGR